MANRTNKRIKALKRNYSWIWMIVLAILELIIGALLAVLVTLFGSGTVKDKYRAEADIARITAQAYVYGRSTGTDMSAYIESLERDHFIIDASGNITDVSGGNTCVMESSGTSEWYDFLTLYLLTGDEKVYPDALSKSVFIADDEDIGLNIVGVFRDIGNFLENDIDPEVIHDGELNDPSQKMLSIPLWIGVDLGDGEHQFVCKSYITFEMYDILTLGAVIIGTGVLNTVIFVLLIVNLVSSNMRRGKTLKVFFTDAVTQGNNLLHFVYNGENMLKKRRSYSTGYAVISITFVNYHNFCVCHSVDEGEQMLCRIYDMIRSSADKRDLCAHAGSGEFALLVKYTDDDELLKRVKALISLLEKADTDHKFSFHTGIKPILPDGAPDSAGVPIRRRDIDFETEYTDACTAARSLGHGDDSGVAFFDGRLVEEQKWIDTVTERQENALANEEFLVYYQPKYDPATDTLRGAEALIRWQSPEFGLIPPGRFIPIFETNGFITEIDHYMLRHAARDQKMWYDKGLKCVPVSVNVSRAHFIESDLAEQIRDIIDREGTPHELIEIELTESAFFDNKKAMINTITKLKEYGFAVSMDDFGSGYSSLNSLKDMPLDVLKLDAEFFRGEADAERAQKVISEAIRLAKILNMRTVAEGVEIREQVDFLAAQGCDMIQGYYYSKPLPKAEFEQKM